MEQQYAPGLAPVGHKTYVFVDEYNRHKRLKVMRACDGCRKRKIRCDGALQNGPWPCGACIRLKLKCIPPTVDQDDDFQSQESAAGPGQFTFSSAASHSIPQHRPGPQLQTMSQEWPGSVSQVKPEPSTEAAHMHDANAYSAQVYSRHPSLPTSERTHSEEAILATPANTVQCTATPPHVPTFLQTQPDVRRESSGDPQDVDATVRELSEHMGELAIDLSSAAPYITNEKRNLAEVPAVEEVEVLLPASVSSDLTVRIPPEMMPSEERALDYFGYFFEYVHPYVPVLNRNAFYEQWRTARHSISPLILEGIFACVARYLEEPTEVRTWLALASKHEESFKDVPRMSTIQALIILTKAREFVPKRGYYYRSWMAVKYMTTMAFDLGLHEHLDKHRAGAGCGLSPIDCIIHTRTWQTLFGLEVWIGAPQARTDFAVEHETVDFSFATSDNDPDPFERRASRRMTFLAQAVKTIKQTNVLWQRMRRQNPDWALDPTFVEQNEIMAAWHRNLPPDMQVHYPEDGSPPVLGGEHFVANLHVYFHLLNIIQHRPQLQTLLEKRDPDFKIHLDTCNISASFMCRLHEAIYRDYGLHGLQFMQRGIGFTIYGVLTCIMMHLASITSPDPTTNCRARDLFTRHMRILEYCSPSASPDVQLQISALREAFSQDTSKPFELKANLGLRSPSSEGSYPTPTMLQSTQQPSLSAATSWSHLQDATSSKTLSPTGEYVATYDPHTSLPSAIPYTAVPVTTQRAFSTPGLHVTPPPQQHAYTVEPISQAKQGTPVWDPSGIFQQWNTAFGPPTARPPQQSPIPGGNAPPAFGASRSLVMPGAIPSVHNPVYSQTPASAGPQDVPQMPPANVVTPGMWQDAFTNAYVSGHGHKRYRESNVDYGQYKRRA